MSFFNEVSKKITQTGQDAVQKAKNTTETIRLNSLISEENKRIDAVCLQLGKMYYETYGGQPEQQFVQYVNSVNDAKLKISDYANQIKLLKSNIRCPYCGNESPFGTSICSVCGSMMAGSSKDVEAEPAESTATAVPAPPPSVQVSVPVAPTEPSESVEMFCTNCGSPVSPNKAFCRNCGSKIEQPAAIEKPAETESVVSEDSKKQSTEPVVAVCSVCGTELEEDAAFCLSCGAKV